MTVMFRSNPIRRLPKKLLAGLAVLTVILLAAGGGAAKRADAGGTYTILVTWQSVSWTAIDDGIGDQTAEVYGTLQADSFGVGQHVHRMLGNAGKGTCTSGWLESGLCNKRVNVGQPYNFADTKLSSSTAANQPASNYTKLNNTIKLQANGGNLLHFFVDLRDYDALSANDPMCQVSGGFTFTDAQLQTLNTTQILQQPHSASDGTCRVVINLRRIP